MNWGRAAVGVAAGAPLIALLAFGLTRDPNEIPSPLPGRDAPEFALQVLTFGDTAAPRPAVQAADALRDTIRLASMRGEIVVLNFFASWCAPCRIEHEPLNRVARRYAGEGVHFIGVLYQDSPTAAMRWIAEMGGQLYPALQDDGARTAIDYGLYGVPETFFIGRDGRVAYKHVGPVTESLLLEQIEGLRTAAPPGSAAEES